ncbi:hypothetical protein K503DRAFT_768604 [Rhizopogon vinicolor AM-OR11-026]|uniref:Uncharacterized protein n=1 Tax=Rhizopogon vinicolor AM-OR11-026 TaxID=1314800 RepID=A0A1B7N6D1_9AGAM|nr:hypothetical protein K503DRAFT_768604 [Rhizopogon vinicolor AM-OR11-026]
MKRAAMLARPSEQWEIVMDSIAEVDEETVNTLKSNRAGNSAQAGEFGTNGGKASNVSSSLKAIATSLGLKRGNEYTATSTTASSKSSLASTQSGQSQSTAPTEQEPEVEPVPGQSALAGRPAPSNARLSISQEPATTTIRLVSSNAPTNSLFSPPRLHPFKTSFDLAPPTPGGLDGGDGGMWPLSPGAAQSERIYPAIPTFSAFERVDTSDMDIDVDFPGSLQSTTPARRKFKTGATPKSADKPSDVPQDLFSPAPKLSRAREQESSFRPQRSPIKAGSELGIPRSEAFIFGSPNPQHRLSNAQFRTAAQTVLDEMNARLEAEGVAGVDMDVLRHRQQSMSSQPNEDDLQQGKKAGTSMGTLFDKAHQAQFDKMDSIANHYAARRGSSKSDAAPVLGKRKSSAAPPSIAGKTRKSSVVVKKDRVPSTSSVKLRPIPKKVVPGGFGDDDEDDDSEREEDKRQSKRVRVDPVEDAEMIREEAKKLKEREAIRRRLDANKAKRRSSMGRPSMGKGIIHQPKQTSRFGFLSSAKNLVANVWNRGAGGSKSNVPPAKPALAPAPPTKPAVPSISSKPTKEPPKLQLTAKKASVIPGASGTLPIPKERAPSVSNGKRVPSGSSLSPAVDSTTSSRSSRPQIPAFTAPGTSSIVSHSRTGSATGVSSLGVASRTSNAGGVSSMDTKTSLGGTLKGTTADTLRARTSTLMAPTASSLAKKSRLPVPTFSTFSPLQVKGKDKDKEKHVMEQTTVSPTSPRVHGKIFSQPLAPISPMAKPVESHISLGAAAARLTTAKPPIPPKPKVMPGRRPRISRGKVIAKLASQREAQQEGVGANPKPHPGTPSSRATVGVPKVRSSMSANVGRQSHGVARTGVGGDVMMSAKKRARRSEYVRRRTRVDGEMMSVDE